MAREPHLLRAAGVVLLELGLLAGLSVLGVAGSTLLATTRPPVADQPVNGLGAVPTATARAGAPRSPNSAVSLKPELTGLIQMDGIPSGGYLSAIRAFVVTATWAELQPKQNGPIAADNVIDKAITRAKKAQAEDPKVPLGIELRVNAGSSSPAWAMALDGGPTKLITDASGGDPGISGHVPKFWTADFAAAWSTFMKELAAKYDDVPLIRQANVMSRCMTLLNEPMVRQTDPRSISNLLAAGYTVAADENCQLQEVAEARVWRHTYVSLNVNPYTVVNANHTFTKSDAFSVKVMKYCRTVFGTQCVLQNNEIGRNQNETHDSLYLSMVGLGAPLAYQTANPAQLARGVGFLGALNFAVVLKAADVEVLTASFDRYSPATLAAYSRKYAANGVNG